MQAARLWLSGSLSRRGRMVLAFPVHDTSTITGKPAAAKHVVSESSAEPPRLTSIGTFGLRQTGPRFCSLEIT